MLKDAAAERYFCSAAAADFLICGRNAGCAAAEAGTVASPSAFANAARAAAAFFKAWPTAAFVISASLGTGTGSGLAANSSRHWSGRSASMTGGFGGRTLTVGGWGVGGVDEGFAGMTFASH